MRHCLWDPPLFIVDVRWSLLFCDYMLCWLLYYLFVRFSLVSVLICFCVVFLSRSVVILAKKNSHCHISGKFREPSNLIQPTIFFFLICLLLSQQYGSCYQIVRLYVWHLFLLHFSVPAVPLFSSYSWCVSLGCSL